MGKGPSETGWESDESLALPGGWKVTLGKRKRSTRRIAPLTPKSATVSQSGAGDGKAWGVPEWKRLEKVFRAERERWIGERDIRPLPTIDSPRGILGWMGRKVPEVKEWDPEWVVERFLREEGMQVDAEGEWAR